MTKLWQKNWQLNATIEAFETKGDLELDQELVKYDVWGSLAHAHGLHKIKKLSLHELKLLQVGLAKVVALDNKHQFLLQSGDEDIHTKIENFLTDKYGQVGKKIHTGRSRNDQVLTALRLYTKDNLLSIWQATADLAYSFLKFAKNYEDVPIPGYTHMQKAMPSTVGMWAGAIAAGLLDDLILLKAAYDLNDQSPLGSAAGYGVPLNIDREYTAKKMGFSRVQTNSLYCQNSRGKIEAAVLASLVAIMADINKFATDVLQFTTSEFNFFDVAKELCTGSSIMPQKKNVDVAELLRSKVHLILGNYVQIASLSSNLISGYNRDAQDGKKPLFESLAIVKNSLEVAGILLDNIKIKPEVMQKALTPEIFAAHQAFSLLKTGMTFRDAHQKIGSDLNKLSKNNFEPCDSGLLYLYQQVVEQGKIAKANKQQFALAIKHLFS